MAVYPNLNTPPIPALVGWPENDAERGGRLADEMFGDEAINYTPQRVSALTLWCWDLGRRANRFMRHLAESSGPLPKGWMRPSSEDK